MALITYLLTGEKNKGCFSFVNNKLIVVKVGRFRKQKPQKPLNIKFLSVNGEKNL